MMGRREEDEIATNPDFYLLLSLIMFLFTLTSVSTTTATYNNRKVLRATLRQLKRDRILL